LTRVREKSFLCDVRRRGKVWGSHLFLCRRRRMIVVISAIERAGRHPTTNRSSPRLVLDRFDWHIPRTAPDKTVAKLFKARCWLNVPHFLQPKTLPTELIYGIGVLLRIKSESCIKRHWPVDLRNEDTCFLRGRNSTVQYHLVGRLQKDNKYLVWHIGDLSPLSTVLTECSLEYSCTTTFINQPATSNHSWRHPLFQRVTTFTSVTVNTASKLISCSWESVGIKSVVADKALHTELTTNNRAIARKRHSCDGRILRHMFLLYECFCLVPYGATARRSWVG
jgi:hypothetical protein